MSELPPLDEPLKEEPKKPTRMFPNDEVRKKVLYHVGVWLMIAISLTVLFGNPANPIHMTFLREGMQLIAWLVLGVVFNTGVEVLAARFRKGTE